MATDPVQQIRELEHDTPLAIDLTATLTRLAALPASTEAPYLTVSLDWRPEGSAPGRFEAPEPKRSERRAPREEDGAPRRPAWQELRRGLEDTVNSYGPRGAAFESLTADMERLTIYLDEELDPAATGVVIIACHHQDVFEPVPLDVPVDSGFTVGPIPSLRQLARAADDYPPYAIIAADQRDAVLWLMEGQTWDRGVQLEASGYPRKQQQGGWSQQRYQNRADERVEAFARTIAEETRRAFEAVNAPVPYEYLIIAANEQMFTLLNAELHETIKERVLGQITLPIEANITEVTAAAQPLVEDAERKREMEAVQAVRDGVGAGGKGVAGAVDTITALETGQVMTLVMNDDFSQPGWADYTLPLYGVGSPPREHPAGGDVANLVPTTVEDEVVRLALQIGADVELVRSAVPVGLEEQEQIPDADNPTPRAEAARSLDEMGGIGAILRYALDEGQPTADL
jgi:Bacterial archaeo-eukaryotic release factor family 10